MDKSVLKVAAFACVVASAALARAQSTYIINDFEPGGQNDLGWNVDGALASLTPEQFNGSTALKAVTNSIPGYFATLSSAYVGRNQSLFNAIAAGTALQLDVGTLSDGIVNPGPQNFFLVRLVVSTDAWTTGGGNYRAFDNIFLGAYAQNGTLSVSLVSNPDIGAAAANYAAGGGSYFGFILDNNGYPPDSVAGNTFYFDNFRVTGISTDKIYQRSGSGDWNASGSWNGAAPNAVDSVVVFGGTIGAPSTVFTDTPVTAGTIRFDSPNRYLITGTGSLTLSTTTGSALVNVLQGNHKIALPVAFTGDSTVAVAGSSSLLISDQVTLADASTLTKSGEGTLTFAGRVSTSGSATVQLKGGVVNLDIANTDGNLSLSIDPSTVNIGASQTLARIALDAGGNTLVVGKTSGNVTVNASVNVGSVSVTAGAATNVINVTKSTNALTTGTLSVDAGGRLEKQGPGLLAAQSTQLDGSLTQSSGTSALGKLSGRGELAILAGTVSISGGTSELGALSIAPGATLNIGTGSLVLHQATSADQQAKLTELTAAAANWFANGARTGTGLSATASAYTTVAVVANVTSSGAPYFAQYGGVNADATDLIIRYTYLGDTNLDGVLDGRDFKNVFEGFTTGQSGWLWGDVDNSGGPVTTADLSLFLDAYAAYRANPVPLGGPSSDGSGGVSSIPEPAMILPLLGAVGLGLRKRRTL
jgi:hypothetical protein